MSPDFSIQRFASPTATGAAESYIYQCIRQTERVLDPQAPREGDKDPVAGSRTSAESNEDKESDAAPTLSEDKTEWERWSAVRPLHTSSAARLLNYRGW